MYDKGNINSNMIWLDQEWSDLLKSLPTCCNVTNKSTFVDM